MNPLNYPQARRDTVTDTYHGTLIQDPYRWLEDPNSPDSRAWIEAQTKLTRAWFEEIPERTRIHQRLRELWNFERYAEPFKVAGTYFYRKNDGLQNQSVLYVADRLEDQARVLLDPNTLSKDGTVSVRTYSVSEDARYLAYSLSDAGSDWQIFYVRDIKTNQDLPDQIRWCKFGGAAWTKDNQGFFYTRFPESAAQEAIMQNPKIYYHRLGTPQAEDELIYERFDRPDWLMYAFVTDDGTRLLIHIQEGTQQNNRLYYKDLTQKKSAVVPLLDRNDASYTFIDNEGNTFWLLASHGAPRGRVVAIDLENPESTQWQTIIAESSETLQSVSLVGNRFIANYLKDAHTQIRVFGLDGKSMGEVRLPGIGSAGGFKGKRDESEVFYYFTGFSTPLTYYRYDVKTGESCLFKPAKLAFDPSEYETRQVFYTSKDGTTIPMFISSKKNVKCDGRNPTLLYGYGGFNHTMTPLFSVANLAWMELGGIYAVANIRGGGEYGQAWHEAGIKEKRQNVFDDFIAAAEYLISEKYTTKERLAIAGRSNGGLLVGACMTQRPDLFGAVLADMGVMDMLRFTKFTVGWAWVSDYGSPEDPAMFKILRSYSPLHNVKAEAAYPPTLISTADHDDRVVPAHSYKFTAALQHAQSARNPILLRVETRAGHGMGTPIAHLIDAAADKWAFLVRVLKMEITQ